eukprot:11435741-Alexandrium_andersonii.AAC.1
MGDGGWPRSPCGHCGQVMLSCRPATAGVVASATAAAAKKSLTPGRVQRRENRAPAEPSSTPDLADWSNCDKTTIERTIVLRRTRRMASQKVVAVSFCAQQLPLAI